MNLLIDIGNTNVKWAWHDGKLFGFGEFAHRKARVDEVVAAIVEADHQPDDIWIAGVAGAFVSALGTALQLDFGVEPNYVKVAPEAYGVCVGYRHPERLGVDRWLAMVAARAGCAGAVCVADAGTALTVDALLDDGRHLGGVIAPGITLMQQCVLDDTAEVASHAVDSPDTLQLFADDTASAVRSGALYAAVGLIEYAAAVLDEMAGEPVTVFLTGGSAAVIAPAMRREVHVLRELVLRGLAVVVEQRPDVDTET